MSTNPNTDNIIQITKITNGMDSKHLNVTTSNAMAPVSFDIRRMNVILDYFRDFDPTIKNVFGLIGREFGTAKDTPFLGLTEFVDYLELYKKTNLCFPSVISDISKHIFCGEIAPGILKLAGGYAMPGLVAFHPNKRLLFFNYLVSDFSCLKNELHFELINNSNYKIGVRNVWCDSTSGQFGVTDYFYMKITGVGDLYFNRLLEFSKDLQGLRFL